MPVYVAEVRDDNDPEQAGRLKVRVPAIADGDLPEWILPRSPAGRVLSWVPPVGELVYVETIGGLLRWHAAPVEGGVKWPGNATADYPRRVVLSGRDGVAGVVLVEGGDAYLLAGAGGAITLATTDSAPVEPIPLGDKLNQRIAALESLLDQVFATLGTAAVGPTAGLQAGFQSYATGAALLPALDLHLSRVSSTE